MRFPYRLSSLIALTVIQCYGQTLDLVGGSDVRVTRMQANTSNLQAVGLGSLEGKLPAGALIVRNDSSEPVMTIVFKWSIPVQGNTARTQWLNVDGYYGPQPEPALSPGATALVTVNGMLGEEDFAELAQNPAMFGSPLVNPYSDSSVIELGTVGTIDAIFFADGKIEGEDSSQYEKTIQNRHSIFLSLLSEFHESTSAVEVKQKAALIASQAPNDGADSSALLRRKTAREIERSSDPIALLAVLKQHTIPATFYHSEGKKPQGGSDAMHQ